MVRETCHGGWLSGRLLRRTESRKGLSQKGAPSSFSVAWAADGFPASLFARFSPDIHAATIAGVIARRGEAFYHALMGDPY